MKASIPIIVAGSLYLAACVSMTPAEKARVVELKLTADICDILPAITYDGRLDTPLTKAQIKKYNAKRNAFCNSKETTK